MDPRAEERSRSRRDPFAEAVAADGRRRLIRLGLLGGGLVAAAVVGVVLVTSFIGGSGSGKGEPSRVIKAEDEPIKTRPENPGGMEVPNRDILIYQRKPGESEPKVVERLMPAPEQPMRPPAPQPPAAAEAPSAALPPVASLPSPLPPEAPAVPGQEEPQATPPVTATEPAPTAPQPDATAALPPVTKPPVEVKPPATATPAKPGAGYQVQLAASRGQDQAYGTWVQLRQKHSDVLGGLQPTVVRADLKEKGVFYRLRAGPLASEEKARALCQSLTRRSVDCVVVKPSR
jgi:hypothetical protein